MVEKAFVYVSMLFYASIVTIALHYQVTQVHWALTEQFRSAVTRVLQHR